MKYNDNCGWRMGFCALMAGVMALGLTSCCLWRGKSTEVAGRQHLLLDAGWLFHRGDVVNQLAKESGYEDGQWKAVDLPHDYVLDGTYNRTNERNHGYLTYPPAWYRKHLFIPAGDQGRVMQLEFGGIYRNSEVWLNGQFLGRHKSGYTSFVYDISQAAHYGGDNVIAVRVDPTVNEGWWYEGGGIYRHVYLNALAPVHVAQWGTYVVALVPGGNQGQHAEADLTLQTTVENDGAQPMDCTVVSEIIGPDGAVVKTVKTAETVAAGGKEPVEQQTVLLDPQLWSLETPQLYKLRTTILEGDKPVDATTTTFGIRTIYFDADKGFFLNGKHVIIHGVAAHQDFPAVGIAVPDSLEAWRVKQLKLMGCNGWRTAHNPPNEEVLDECDRQGMLVMEENRHLGDSYIHHSPSGTTSTNLADLAMMIQRDRNHPSVIMWSMCNEEGLQGTKEGAKIFSAMMATVHQYDRTRPITSAMNAGWLRAGGDADVEDIIGVNYAYQSYDAIHKAHPHKAMFGSETSNNKTARGEYTNDVVNGWVGAYNLTEPVWKPIADREYMAGAYVWTGFDYKGEPNPNGWPDVANNTGILDSCGFPKDKAYYLKAWSTDQPMVHLLPANWNWAGKEGQNIRVIVFGNTHAVELFLNGKSLGSQVMPQFSHLEWQVPYAPGQLLAKGIGTDGQVVATDVQETTGAPASMQLAPDRQTLHADGADTLVVPVSILDAQGRLVPDASNRVTFELTGAGKFLGVGNGNPADHDPDRAMNRRAFNGRCIAVIQAGVKHGTIHLTAKAEGVAEAHLTVEVK